MTHDTFHDLETRSPVPIKYGTHVYAEHCEVTLWAYAGSDDEPRVWDVVNSTDNYLDEMSGLWVEEPLRHYAMIPAPLRKTIDDPEALVWFHNGGMFDFVVLDRQMPWFTQAVPLARRRDTMVQAFAHSLPGALEKLGIILKLTDAESKLADEGKRLIRLFCVPRKDGGYNGKDTHPEDWQKFIVYAARDITTMRAARRLLPVWNYRDDQIRLWHHDLVINNRGVQIDVDFAAKAVLAAEKARDEMKRCTHVLTDGQVQSTTQRDVLLAFICNIYGVELPDMQSDTIERRLEDPDLPEEVKELLRIRLRASMNSVSKYRTVLRGVNSDNRLRGGAQFRGALRTGRWAHRLFQYGNMPRPAYPWEFIMAGVEAIKAECLDMVVDNEMEMCASAIRCCIVAPPGRKLVVSDLSNIEGRVAAWLAGESWVLRAFRDYDTVIGEDDKGKKIRKGADLYVLSYMGSFNADGLSSDEHEAFLQRQIGKVQCLMFQYGGGVGAWITGAATYGIDLVAMAEAVYETLPQDVIDEAVNFLAWLYEQQAVKRAKALEKLSKTEADITREAYAAKLAAIEAEFSEEKARFGLSEKVFITCDSLKRLWRRSNQAISSYWKELEETVVAAIDSPGTTLTARKLKIRRDGTWLRIRLPSGRYLCYPNIHLTKDGSIAYTGQNTYSRVWGEVKTYGGKIFENCVAAGTPVLTSRGWTPIEYVTSNMLVWDGIEWVEHAGCVYRGKQLTLRAFNVRMTPDHRVLTTEGWRHASSCKGYHRAPCRLPDGYPLPRQRWEAVSLGLQMPLRQDSGARGFGDAEAAAAGDSSLMWLHAQTVDIGQKHTPRDVVPPGICGLPQHAGSVPSPDSSCLGQLRRTWHNGVRPLARVVFEFLGRHGAHVRSWLDTRTCRQRKRILENELHLGYAQSANTEPSQNTVSGNSRRSHDASRCRNTIRCEVHDTAVAVGSRLAGTESIRPVYDLMNCGPRQRFVVLGSDNKPLIVHNCVQAVACDQFAEVMPACEAAGYELVAGVHDEWIAEVDDDDQHTAAGLAEIMVMDLGWNQGLPLAAAGFETKTYHKG